MPKPVLLLSPVDPIGIALDDLDAGDAVTVQGLHVATPIPKGHKIALRDISEGEMVTKFGTVIGTASAPVPAGSHVHTQNLAFRPPGANRNLQALGHASAMPMALPTGATFEGYQRADGRVGTRNVLVVMATVNCSATVAKRIASVFKSRVDLSATPAVDDVVALTHQHGCSFKAAGADMDILRRTLGGYAEHPNVAGVLVVGLGCEDNQIDGFLAAAGLVPSPRLRTLVIQETGGSLPTVEAGVAVLREMLAVASTDRRQTVSARHLTLALQCGGSDAFSALSANPALGVAADLLVAEGGTAILSETPEIYGAEQLLLERAANPEIAERLISLLEWWERSAAEDEGDLNNNPSPGNKAGGITTILEKSLGAVAKSGSSPLRGVYAYAERVDGPGLVFMDSPGFDPVSATGQIAAGANVVCFTTGRGSCFGAAPVPSLKLATNSALYHRMEGDIDINCGTIVDGLETHDEVGRRIFRDILAVASGRPTKSELLGYGEAEFIPWARGLIY
ncbi:UxaA family hydrolase [Aureimonas sp. AU4]|uniref:UxaA family hydrolase n=1 Tax=Aureimonas sp. AU4 TaxID=1638163 RepID=UPI0007803139|nr:altronate dehydratase family protein [Aureimonas sp. AU4]